MAAALFAAMTLPSCNGLPGDDDNPNNGNLPGGGSSVLSGIWVSDGTGAVSIEITGENSVGSVAKFAGFAENYTKNRFQEALGIGGEIYRVGSKQKVAGNKDGGDFNPSGNVSMGWNCQIRRMNTATGEILWTVARGIYFYANVETGFESLRMIGDEWSERWVRPEGYPKKDWSKFTGEEEKPSSNGSGRSVSGNVTGECADWDEVYAASLDGTRFATSPLAGGQFDINLPEPKAADLQDINDILVPMVGKGFYSDKDVKAMGVKFHLGSGSRSADLVASGITGGKVFVVEYLIYVDQDVSLGGGYNSDYFKFDFKKGWNNIVAYYHYIYEDREYNTNTFTNDEIPAGAEWSGFPEDEFKELTISGTLANSYGTEGEVFLGYSTYDDSRFGSAPVKDGKFTFTLPTPPANALGLLRNISGSAFPINYSPSFSYSDRNVRAASVVLFFKPDGSDPNTKYWLQAKVSAKEKSTKDSFMSIEMLMPADMKLCMEDTGRGSLTVN